MKTKKTKEVPKTDIELQHQNIVRDVGAKFLQPDTQSLEQPTPYRVVQTVTTYSAYEEPI